MSQTATTKYPLPALGAQTERSAAAFAVAALTVVVASAILAGFVPLAFSIVTVFLFAGPHNWVEFRYFISRMPARWGSLRAFFVTAITGVLTLTAAFIVLPALARRYAWDGPALGAASSVWNSALVLWIAALVALRDRDKLRRAAGRESATENAPANPWLLPMAVAWLLVAGVWLCPAAWDLGIVYLHPLIALWFLDREIARRRPAWQQTYRRCLLAIPAALAVLWWRLADSPPLVGDDMLTMRITRHAGAEILTGISSHALVATHTFLEMIHYGVWVVAIPLVAMRSAPWDLTDAPLSRRSPVWRTLIAAAAVGGLLIVLGLWGAFLVDYPLTRDVYFTVAIGHILAEASFLLRLL